MGIISKPNTFSNATTIDAPEVNDDFDTIYAEFNGNIDDSNIKAGANIDGGKLLNASIVASTKLTDASISDAKVDYTAVKVMRTGPNTAGNGRRQARGSKAYTLVAGVVSVTITFASDSDDGNPNFAATPRVTLGHRHASSAASYSLCITAVSSSSFTVEIRSSNGTDVTSGNVDWQADGLV